MAINYTNLFTLIGKCVQAANYYKSTFATMKTNGNEMFQVTADQNLDHLGDGVANAVSSHISGLSSGAQYWASKVTDILLDPTLVTNHLAITSVSLQTVLPALWEDMSANNQTIVESSPVVGSLTTVGVGNGTLLTHLYLDDVSNPVLNPSASNMNYFSGGGELPVGSQLAIPDTVFVRCTSADAEESEQFTIFGNGAVDGFSEGTESVGGSISTQPTMSSSNLFTNGDFETYSSGFTGWTINDAGGTLVQETSGMYRGASACRINTLANADNVVIEQTLATALTRGKAYIVGFRIKSVAAEASGNIEGTVKLFDGSTEIASETLNNIPVNTTSWQIAHTFIICPKDIDPDVLLKVQINLSPSVDGVDGIIIDDAFIVPATYFNGVAITIVTGSTRFRAGDLISFPITSSNPGTFQEFFRKVYKIQLPSTADTFETIADSLAE